MCHVVVETPVSLTDRQKWNVLAYVFTLSVPSAVLTQGQAILRGSNLAFETADDMADALLTALEEYDLQNSVVLVTGSLFLVGETLALVQRRRLEVGINQ